MRAESPINDLDAIIEVTPYWVPRHGAMTIERLKKFILDNGGDMSYAEINESKKKKGIAQRQ